MPTPPESRRRHRRTTTGREAPRSRLISLSREVPTARLCAVADLDDLRSGHALDHTKAYTCVHVFEQSRPVLYVTRPEHFGSLAAGTAKEELAVGASVEVELEVQPDGRARAARVALRRS